MKIREFISSNKEFIRNSCVKYRMPGYLDTDDLFQEVCIKLLKYLDKDLNEEDYFKVTGSVVYSTFITLVRGFDRPGYQLKNTVSIDDEESVLQLAAPNTGIGKLLYQKVCDDYKYHEDFNIFKHVMHGYTFSDVSKLLGININTAKGKYFRLLNEIKKVYDERRNDFV